MSNRVAIITGATRGIGHGIAERLMAGGINIAAVYCRDEEAAIRLRNAGKIAGVRTLVEKCDVAAPTELERFATLVAWKFGRVDYLVNNVGIDIFKPVAELTYSEWKLSQDIILNAPFILSKAVLPSIASQKFCSVYWQFDFLLTQSSMLPLPRVGG